MNKCTFPYVYDAYWVTIPICICIHLSNGVMFGECMSRQKLLLFFISKLTEFSFKIWNNRDLEWWYRSGEVGRYNNYDTNSCSLIFGLEPWFYNFHFIFLLYLLAFSSPKPIIKTYLLAAEVVKPKHWLITYPLLKTFSSLVPKVGPCKCMTLC